MTKGANLKSKEPEAKTISASFKRKPAFYSVSDSPFNKILFLQRTIGNQAVQRLFKSGVIQSKLRIGEPSDIYEQEADRVAEQVMRMPDKTVASDQLSVAGKENNGSIRMKPS